jgi:hypothetical protein
MSLMTFDDKREGLMHMMMSSYLFRFSLTCLNVINNISDYNAMHICLITIRSTENVAAGQWRIYRGDASPPTAKCYFLCPDNSMAYWLINVKMVVFGPMTSISQSLGNYSSVCY